MQIVYDGARFIAVDKPAGWLSVPSRMGAEDPRPCLGPMLEKQIGARLWPVHRLDLEVSGLVLFARDPDAHRAANAWFEGHSVQKTYDALSEGTPKDVVRGAPLEWRSMLLRGKKRAYVSPHGKVAVTRAIYKGPDAGWQRWSLEPLTGRPHQLRVHLAAIGCPIAGDTLYGATQPWSGEGIGLRAVRLEFLADDAPVLELPPVLEASPLVAG